MCRFIRAFACITLLLLVGCGEESGGSDTNCDSGTHEENGQCVANKDMPDTTEPDTIVEDISEPDTNEPDTNEPDIAEPDIAEPDTNAPKQQFPLYFSTMTHLEGGVPYESNEKMFNNVIVKLEGAMALASKYDAMMTIESEKPFATACVDFNRNFLAEVLAAGHGVGTHCDIGVPKPNQTTLEEFTANGAENKGLVDALVGPENNLGCSGGGGYVDWVQGLKGAGFSYTNGAVGMSYLCMDDSSLPDGMTKQYIKVFESHAPAPFELMDRIYVRMLKDGADFKHDAEGGLVLLGGGLGRPDAQFNNEEDKTFTMEDVDALIATVQAVDKDRDPGRFARINVHLSVEHLLPRNSKVLEYFYSSLQKLQQEGTIQWETEAGTYQAYMDSL